MSAAVPSRSRRGIAPRLGPFGPPLLLVAIMWGVELLDVLLRGALDDAGIWARDGSGLIGVLFAPFLHVGFAHLIANTLPLLVLGTLVASTGRGTFWRATAAITVLGGLGTWLIAPVGSLTIGASGLVFGYLGFLLVAGVRTRDWVDLLIGAVVLIGYGTLLQGALPWAVAPGTSWQAHLCGLIAGGASAWWWAAAAPSRS